MLNLFSLRDTWNDELYLVYAPDLVFFSKEKNNHYQVQKRMSLKEWPTNSVLNHHFYLHLHLVIGWLEIWIWKGTTKNQNSDVWSIADLKSFHTHFEYDFWLIMEDFTVTVKWRTTIRMVFLNYFLHLFLTDFSVTTTNIHPHVSDNNSWLWQQIFLIFKGLVVEEINL